MLMSAYAPTRVSAFRVLQLISAGPNLTSSAIFEGTTIVTKMSIDAIRAMYTDVMPTPIQNVRG